MGMEAFTTVVLAKNAHDAFDKARREAFYWHGHGGDTGTIAEKKEFKFCGKVNTWYWDQLHEFYEHENAREHTPANRLLPGRKPPKSMAEIIKKTARLYSDKYGPAMAFQITGTKALDFKREAGRIESHDKVFIFVGIASS